MIEGISRKRLIITAVLSAVILLTVIQFATYWLFAEASMPVAGIRIWFPHRLERLENKMQFICVTKECWDSLTDSQKSRLNKELTALAKAVYYSDADIPEEMNASRPMTDEDRTRIERYLLQRNLSEESTKAFRRQLETGRVYVGLKDGMSVNWSLDERGLFRMRCSSGYFVAPLGAEGIQADFVWVFGFWVKIHTLWHLAA